MVGDETKRKVDVMKTRATYKKMDIDPALMRKAMGLLGQSFCWHYSKEGIKFWQDIRNRLEGYAEWAEKRDKKLTP